MSNSVCRFYIKGNCKFGSSCRFSHSDHSNNHYQDEYRPRKNANREHNYGNSNDGRNYEEYGHYERFNHQPDIVEYHSKRDHNSRNNNNRKNYNNYNNENYNSYDDNYHSNYNYIDDNYHSDYKYNKKKENNVRNYYKENDNDGDGKMSYNHDRNNFHDNNMNNGEHIANSYRSLKDRSNHKNGYVQEKENKLKYYEKEIQSYRTHINQLLHSSVWPFTCCQPIGGDYPIQPVGSLNLPDVSFEELRCDYYILKNMVADPASIHKHSVDELLFKAQRQKENIVSFEDHVQTDMLATFNKCEQSKMGNPSFQNYIQTDPNNYWDMSQRYLNNPVINNAQMDAFSFVMDNETTQNAAPPLKILMQLETYGQVNCEAYTQEQFTDFIPIMPPPRNLCL